MLRLVRLLLFVTFMLSYNAYGQSEYGRPARLMESYDYSQRVAPQVPPLGEKIRVIIDSDARNEIDDQWALALALLSQDRLQIEGFIAANYDNQWHGGPPSIENSYQEILKVLRLMDVEGQFPVYRGSPPMRYKYEPSESEGVDFIIEKAMASTPEAPLWVVALGSATNLASAWLKEPRIADRVIYLWHGRTRWPDKLWNFNVFGDRHAAITLFHAPVPFVLFDTGTYLTISMEESEAKVRPYGKIGEYLHDFRKTNSWFMQSDKGFFDLGDIAVLVDPSVGYWQEVSCPDIDPDLTYRFKEKRGKIMRCYHVDRDATFQLLFDKLQAAYPSSEAE